MASDGFLYFIVWLDVACISLVTFFSYKGKYEDISFNLLYNYSQELRHIDVSLFYYLFITFFVHLQTSADRKCTIFYRTAYILAIMLLDHFTLIVDN